MKFVIFDSATANEIAIQTENLRWILATVSQGSAAFVAIIAGFQLSRILTISSMRQTLESRRSFLSKEITMLEEDLAYLEQEIDAKNHKDFAKLYLDEIVAMKGNREQIWENWSKNELDLMPDFLLTSHFCTSVSGAFAALEKSFPGVDDIPALDGIDFEVDDFCAFRPHGVLDAVRKSINLDRARIRSAQERATSNKMGQSTWMSQINSIAGNYQDLLFEKSLVSLPNFVFEHPDHTHISNLKRFSEQDELLAVKMDELEHLEQEITRLRSTKGLKGAFSLIFGFGVIGVITPLVLSLYTHSNPLMVTIAMISAFSGLFIAMMIYMFAQLKMVRGGKTE